MSVHFDPTDPRNELHSRPADHLKVFVSSKMKGGALKAQRRRALETIDAFPVTKAWAWERDASAGPYSSEAECVREAGTSDALVLILDEDITPITRAELTAARAACIPVFVMLKQNAQRSVALERLIAEIRSEGITTVTFASTGELDTQITKAIHTWAIRSPRAQMLHRRRSTKPGPIAREPFGGVEVQLDSGEFIPVSKVIKKAAEQVRDGELEPAIDTVSALALDASEIGLGWLALEILDALGRIVPLANIPETARGWILNTRGLALGQADREDDARLAFEQMRQLARTLSDPDMESTALQNLAVGDVEAGRHASARKRIVQSVRLKQQIGDWHGSMQLLLNAVNVLIGQQKLSAAEGLLDDLQKILGSVRDPMLRSSLHGQRGTLAVARKQYAQAHGYFLDALAAARRAHSAPRQIVAMQNLGAVSADLGKAGQARRWYAKALAVAEGLDDHAQVRRQRQALALMTLRTGEAQAAAELFEIVAAEAHDAGDTAGQAIALGDTGASWLEAGEPERARSFTERALALVGMEDERWRAGQLLNLSAELEQLKLTADAVNRAVQAANLFTDWADEAHALTRAGELALQMPGTAQRGPELFRREIKLRRKHESGEQWGWRAAEVGATLSHTSQAGQAVEFFTLALRVFAARGEERQSFFIRNDRALAHGDTGYPDRAARDLRACLQIAERLKDRALAQQAHMNLGEIERRRGHLAEAIMHLTAALSLAGELEDPRAEADTQALLALTAEDADDPDAADAHREHLERLAGEIGDLTLLASAIKGRGHAAFARGAHGQAGRLFRRAARLLVGPNQRQLVESLGGLVAAEAWCGRIDEKRLQQLVELSAQLGWDEELLDDLELALIGIQRAGNDEQAAELSAVTLLVALRIFLRAEDNEEDWTPIVRAAALTGLWIAQDNEAATARRRLVDETVERTSGLEARDAVEAVLDQAQEVLAGTSAEDE